MFVIEGSFLYKKTRKDRSTNPYSDNGIERDMYGGVNCEEFDKDFGYQNTASYDHATRDVLSGSTDYIFSKPFQN